MKFYIREIRREQGLSIEKLAKLAKVGNATISDAENGKTIPCIVSLCKIARALNVEVTKLFEMEEADFE